MKKYIIFLISMVIYVYSSFSFAEEASLMLYPTKLEVLQKDKVVNVNVVNKGDARGLYRIEMQDAVMNDNGSLNFLGENDEKYPYSIQDFVTFSPKRMVLEPGQSQTVRIRFKKPADLSEGEYRSHLAVTLINKNVDETGRSKDKVDRYVGNSVAIEVDYMVKMSVPIFYYNSSNISSEVKIDNATYDNKDGAKSIMVSLTREGNNTVRGDFEIYHINNEGNKKLIGERKGSPIYFPSKKVNIQFPISDSELGGIDLKKGSVYIKYYNVIDKKDVIIAEKTVQL